MKKLIAIATIAALAACSQLAEKAPAPAETAATDAATAAADDMTGTFDVKMTDGTMAKTIINADGTYVDVGPDGSEVKGTFTRADGQDCFDPEGDEAATCWTVTPAAADGSFSATTVDGKTTVTVTRAADGAPAAPAPAAT